MLLLQCLSPVEIKNPTVTCFQYPIPTCIHYSSVFLWFVCVSPFFYVSLSSWVISLTVFGASITNLNEPLRALATSTIAWVRSQLHPFWVVVNKSNAGYGGYYVAGPPLLNERCTSLLRAPVSEMTYTVSSGTLNSTIPYLYPFRQFSKWFPRRDFGTNQKYGEPRKHAGKRKSDCRNWLVPFWCN